MNSELKEGEDYYLDPNGLLVLTEAYHIKKEVCCGFGCRHCPYDYLNVPEPGRSKLLTLRSNDKK